MKTLMHPSQTRLNYISFESYKAVQSVLPGRKTNCTIQFPSNQDQGQGQISTYVQICQLIVIYV